jgi:hypothetical protein
MRVDVDEEAKLFALAEEGDSVVEVLLIVLTAVKKKKGEPKSRMRGKRRNDDVRTGVFDALPGRDKAEGVVSPALQPRKVLVGLIKLQHPPLEAHLSRLCPLPKPFLLPSRLTARSLG